MRFRHLALAAAAVGALATPALAQVSYVNNWTVPGAATDLSGLPSTEGNNRLSIGSDLWYDRATDLFYGMTDRGPGGGLISFQPRIEAFKLDINRNTGAIGGFTLAQTILFKDKNGNPLNGLNPLLLNGNVSTLGNSFDSEGLVRGANGHFYVSDEYGPSVYEFDAGGTLIKSFAPPANLVPKLANGTVDYVSGRGTGGITTGRQDNRGFEGLTMSADGTKLYAILQDPLVNEGQNTNNNSTNGEGRYSRNLRVVEYDVASGNSTAQYIYQLDSLSQINAGLTQTFAANQQGRSIGASSITMLADGSFLVIERDNRGLGVDDPTGLGQIGIKKVYRFTLNGATDVSNISLNGTNNLPAGVNAVTKTLYLDVQAALQAAGLTSVEKLEGLSFGPWLSGGDLSLIIVSDNDFSVTQTGIAGVPQTDVCTSGWGGTSTQVVIGAGCPSGEELIPSYIYSFRVSGDALDGTVVPEPATWAMMIAGFGLVGGALRRRYALTAAA